MLIELSSRVAVHAVEFGYLVETRSGEVRRDLGRHATRITLDYPTGCLPSAFPNRIASHVAALPAAVDPAHRDAGALLIAPAYVRDGRGALRPRWVTIQRLKLFPREDKAGMPGDAVRSSALTFEWSDYNRHSPRLAPAAQRLFPRPVPIEEGRDRRLGRPRPTLTLEPARATAAVNRSLSAILGAARRGQRLRLDERWCATEAEFLESYFGALARLPEEVRGHVSAAAGLVNPDRGHQIVWTADGRGLDPLGSAALALVAESEGETPADPTALVVEDDAAYVGVSNVLAASFEEPGLHALARLAMRRWFQSAGPPPALTAAEAVRLAGLALAGGDVPPVDADRLFAWANESRGLSMPARVPPGASAVLSLLRGLAPIEIPLDGIAAAMDICDRADAHYESKRAIEVRRLAGEMLGARLASTPCPSEATMAEILGRESLAATAARRILQGDRRVIESVRRGLALASRRNGADSALVARLVGALLPRDSRILADWRDCANDDGCLARALFAAADGEGALETQAAGWLAESLLDGGKWNVVREVLTRVVSRLGRADTGRLEDPSENARRLEMLVALAGAMRSASEPDAERPRAAG